MELAQLWRCPVTWCTVWKGTPQDCIDHMRKAHDTPPLVKVANLARWFPPWTIFREQWSSLTRSAVSGIAVDTLLFSRIGMPLFYRYRVFDRPGTHAAFRGTYMQRMRTFLKESDDASLRARHRRRARAMVAQMSQSTLAVGRWTSFLDPGHLFYLARVARSLLHPMLWPSHRTPRGWFVLIAQIHGPCRR